MMPPFTLQLNINGEWLGDKPFKSLMTMVKYANTSHGYGLSYANVFYHITKHGEFKVWVEGELKARMIKKEK